jgi:Replication-relaxation
MSVAEFDFNTIQQQKKHIRKRHKLFTPRSDDFAAPKEFDDLHLHLLAQTALNGVMNTQQYFMADGVEDLKTEDKYRRRLEYLYHSGNLIRLRPSIRQNTPMLYRCTPKGGRVLHAAGLLDRDKIPKSIKNDAKNFFWKHTVMRGDFRVRYARLLREHKLPTPDFKGPYMFRVVLKDRGKEEVRVGESDDFFLSPSRTGFIVEVHRKADD